MELERSRRRLRCLASSSALQGVARLAATITRRDGHSARLLVVGTAAYEPWHVVAHLQSVGSGGSSVGLVRHIVAPGAPAHLSMGLEELARVGRHDVVLFIGADDPAEQLLERLADARRRGGAILALASDAAGGMRGELCDVADETAVVEGRRLNSAQHLLSALAIDRLSR